MTSRLDGFLKSMGPGLLFAGAAIGVSHLVQSTRAGANFGFSLIIVILLANFLKYPFFEYGPRYASATGESLLEGYLKLGRWVFFLFLFLTLATMFVIQAAVTLVTAALATQLFPFSLSILAWSAILLLTCSIVLMFGQYAWLDSLIKFIIILLTVSTIVAFSAALFHHPAPSSSQLLHRKELWSIGGIAFLMALIGWMPSPIESSVWHSLWTLERKKQTQHTPSLEEAQFDFNVGYIGTALLAILFLGLGALIMYPTGKTFSPKAAVFAAQIIKLYTHTLGDWSFIFIAIAAFSTMFSTTMTVFDAYPRVMQQASLLLFPQMEKKSRTLYWSWMFLLGIGALMIISLFLKSLKNMVDFATILSFVTAPLFAFINYKVVMSDNMPDEMKPPQWLRILSWVGLVALSSFGLFYVGWRLWKFF